MKYIKPNFNYEWKEAKRYPEFEKMGKDGWLKFAPENYDIKSYSKIKHSLNNVDLDFDSLEEDKKKRFEEAFEKGKIEIPIAVKFAEDDYDLVGGNTRLAGLVKNDIDPKLWVIDLSSQEAEVDEETGADSSGSYSAPITGQIIKKKEIVNIPNTKKYEVEQDMNEVTDASSSGAYDVPFGNGGKNPLAINGVKSIAQSRAVKDPKFPKWGGPDAVFVKVKEKCKKFPYCNEGPGAIEMYEEIQGLNEAIERTAKKYKLSIKEVRDLVSNEIKQIFI